MVVKARSSSGRLRNIRILIAENRNSRRAALQLAPLISDPDARVSGAAARLVGQLGFRPKALADPLTSMLEQIQARVDESCWPQALNQYASIARAAVLYCPDERVEALLRQAAEHRHPEVRLSTLRAVADSSAAANRLYRIAPVALNHGVERYRWSHYDGPLITACADVLRAASTRGFKLLADCVQSAPDHRQAERLWRCAAEALESATLDRRLRAKFVRIAIKHLTSPDWPLRNAVSRFFLKIGHVLG